MPVGLHYMSALAAAHFTPLFLVAAGGGNGDHGGTPHLPSLVWILHELGILPGGAYRWATLWVDIVFALLIACLLYTSPSPRDRTRSRMPSSA